MGKISDALERHKKESTIKIQTIPRLTPERPPEEVAVKAPIKRMSLERHQNPKLVALTAPGSADAETFKILRSQVLSKRGGDPVKTIMVTSTFPGEGKTFVAANLAVSIALGIDEYVLTVDCDLRRPQLHEMLSYTNVEGLHEHLTGRRPLEELIIRTAIPKLSLLTAGKIPSNPTELLSSRMMEGFLEEVKSRYNDRFIVLDTTPSQITAEASVLAEHVDGIVLVVRAEKTPRHAVHKTLRNLGKEKILGVFFNGFEQADRGYEKYYRKYYAKS